MIFPGSHLRHASNTPAPQTRILVAVAPTVHCTLNEAALSTKARVELSKCPAYSVALGLIMQAIALVLILGAASTRIDAVLCLEVCRKLVDVNRLNITADRVLHLNPVAGILKCNPLHAILILSHNKWGSCGDGTGSSIGIDIWASWRTCVHVGSADRWSLRWCLRRTTKT